MTRREVKQLQPGDEVYWNDPDDDPETNCSRYYTIRSIRIVGDVVQISDVSGDDLECFAEELS